MDKDSLRKADLGTSMVIVAFGIWVLYQAMQMPMKDSWGGVQNVWFVSPALFPLIVGGAITAFGLLLFRIALKAVGVTEAMALVRALGGKIAGGDSLSEGNYRFLVIGTLLFSFVFLFIPRVDFFLGALWFLVPFISMFYLDEPRLFTSLFRFYIAGTSLVLAFYALGLCALLSSVTEYGGDWLTLVLIVAYVAFAISRTGGAPEQRRRLRTGLVVAGLSPFVMGSVFKYFLLVPMPFEGIVVGLMDMIWYWEF